MPVARHLPAHANLAGTGVGNCNDTLDHAQATRVERLGVFAVPSSHDREEVVRTDAGKASTSTTYSNRYPWISVPSSYCLRSRTSRRRRLLRCWRSRSARSPRVCGARERPFSATPMSFPPRLIEKGTPFERDVLASSCLDAGSDSGFRRTLEAMGAAGKIRSASSTAGASTHLAVVQGRSAATFFGGIGKGAAVKGVCLAAVLVGSTTLVARRLLTPLATPGPAIHSRQRVGTPVPHTDVSPDSARATGPTRVESPSRSAAPSLVTPTMPVPRITRADLLRDVQEETLPPEHKALTPLSSPTVNSLPSLDSEVAALDQVRSFLFKRDSLHAMKQLDAYDGTCHPCFLHDEATVLRVDTLFEQGDAVAAAVLARRLLAEKPLSPHVPHLQLIIDTAQNERALRGP